MMQANNDGTVSVFFQTGANLSDVLRDIESARNAGAETLTRIVTRTNFEKADGKATVLFEVRFS